MYCNFLLGQLRITKAARIKLKRVPLDLIARHAVNEHGNISADENKRNQTAMKTSGKIMSRYAIDPTHPEQGSVLVITQKSWTDTIVQLESETD